MYQDILFRVQKYLDDANRGPVDVSEEVLDQFAADCREALRRQLREDKKDFTLRISNIGRPRRQLQLEKAGAPAEHPSYDFRMKMIIGDLVECASVALLKASGVPVQAEQEQVTLNIADQQISGTYDVKIYNGIWDIKSASPYQFGSKFQEPNGYENIKSDDPFGYLGQLHGYAEADNSKLGGWIVVNKSSGEWSVVEASNDKNDHQEVMQKLRSNVVAVVNDHEIPACTGEEEEYFQKKPTGNRILSSACSFCPYKWYCWPNLQHRPQVVSKGKSPRWKFYTYIDPEYLQEEAHDANG